MIVRYLGKGLLLVRELKASRCAMKAENSMGGRYFYAGLLVVYYFLFCNFVATRNAYSIIVEACSGSNSITM